MSELTREKVVELCMSIAAQGFVTTANLIQVHDAIQRAELGALRQQTEDVTTILTIDRVHQIDPTWRPSTDLGRVCQTVIADLTIQLQAMTSERDELQQYDVRTIGIGEGVVHADSSRLLTTPLTEGEIQLGQDIAARHGLLLDLDALRQQLVDKQIECNNWMVKYEMCCSQLQAMTAERDSLYQANVRLVKRATMPDLTPHEKTQ